MAWNQLRLLVGRQFMKRHMTSSTRKEEQLLHVVDEVKDGIKYQLLTPDNLPGALNVIRNAYLRDEPFSVSLDILSEKGAAEEFIGTCHDLAQHGISFVAKDLKTDEVVGVLLNNIELRAKQGEHYHEKLSENCNFESTRAIFEFAVDLESKVNIFELYNVNSFIEMMYSATLPEYRSRHICHTLTQKSLKLCEDMYNGIHVQNPFPSYYGGSSQNIVIPELATSTAMTNTSQRVLKNLGFESIYEMKYKDLLVGPKRIRISDVHKSCHVFVKRFYKYN